MLPREVKNQLEKLEKLELEIRQLKKAEQEFEDMKNKLYDLMEEYGAESYTTNGGIKFTKVAPSSPKTEIVIGFDTSKFQLDHPTLYKQYVTKTEKVSKGKKGYLRMSLTQKED